MLIFVGNSAIAQESWETSRGACEPVFQEPAQYSLDGLIQCGQIWESYPLPDSLNDQTRQNYVRGFSRIYNESTGANLRMAESALERLGIAPLEPYQYGMNEALLSTSNLVLDRSPIPVGETRSRSSQRASSFNSDGLEALQNGRLEQAIRLFENALNRDRWHLLAKYNLACALALNGDSEGAISTLNELSRWTHEGIPERMRRAAVDDDLISLREDRNFRLITNYTRVQLLNGAGTSGLTTTNRLNTALETAGLHVVSYGYDRNTWAHPRVYYKLGHEEKAQSIFNLETHPAWSIEPITWFTDFDLIVVWGGDDAQLRGSIPTPLVQGTFNASVTGADAEAEGREAWETGQDATNTVQEWMPTD
jgi:tetratricopeptide (TPR) repeat protein